MILLSLNIFADVPMPSLETQNLSEFSLVFNRDQQGICEWVTVPENWAKYSNHALRLGIVPPEFYNTVSPRWCFISIFIISPLFWLDICPTFMFSSSVWSLIFASHGKRNYISSCGIAQIFRPRSHLCVNLSRKSHARWYSRRRAGRRPCNIHVDPVTATR